MLENKYFRCPACGTLNRIAPEKTADHPVCGRCKGALDASGKPQEVDDAALQALVRSAPVPVVVDFWAPWCGPCRMVAPHLENLGKQHAGSLLVVKINTDEHQRTAAALKVQAIPTLAVWKNGVLVQQRPGALMGRELDAFVQPYL